MGSKSGGCNSSTRDFDENNNNKIDFKNNNNNNMVSEEKLDFWRKYFRRAKNCDIFDVIEHAIMVAASDYPKEYRVKRSGIAELLFSCRMTRCFTCGGGDGGCGGGGGGGDGGGSKGSNNDVHVHVHVDDDDDDVGLGVGVGVHGVNDDDDDVDEDVNVDIEGNDGGRGGGVGGGEMELMNENMVVEPCSNFSFLDAEALTDLIEEEKALINEVLRIKDILYNSKDESDSTLFESLRRLELMHLTINILKETEIGKAVNHIRRHSSTDIRNLSRSLIDGWKIIVDEWVKSTQELAEGGTPDSINPSTVDEEEGLPSPPMDDGVFFSTQPIDFNQFFDGVDDDGNIRNSGEFNNNNRQSVRKPSVVKPDIARRREVPPKEATPISKDNRPQQQTRMQPPMQKPNKPSNTQSGPGRPVNRSEDAKVSKDLKVRPKLEKPVVQRRPAPQPEKLRPSNDNLVQDKLEATKRKLQERYQQAENAKRQRTIQVMEIQDLPKQGAINKNPQGRFGNHNRHWANARK